MIFWEADDAIRDAATKLAEAERGLDKAAAAIEVLDAAMKRIADKLRARAGLMADYGFTETEARRFLEAELRRRAASTSFYWESEEPRKCQVTLKLTSNC